MAIDPVCLMEVEEATAKWTSEYKGQTYYFCAPGCKVSFDENPEKYLSGGNTEHSHDHAAGDHSAHAGHSHAVGDHAMHEGHSHPTDEPAEHAGHIHAGHSEAAGDHSSDDHR